MRNKYFIKEGQEELNRALLLMKYDSKKTLTENIQEAEVNEVLNFIPAAIKAISSILPWVAGTAVGGAALTGIGIWISDILGGSNAASKSKIFFDGCKAQSSNLKPTVSKSEYRAAADSIYNAIKGLGTDKDDIKAALASMPTPADLCAMANYYSTTYAEDIYEAIDGDIDGSDWVTYVWSPINPKILDAQEDLENAEKNKTGEDKKDDGKKNLNTRKPDENTKKIQTMLVNKGYYIGNSGPNKDGVDGYYGKKTTAAYEAFNKNESAEDFNQRVYKIGKTQQGGTQQGNVQQGGTQQGNVQQGGTPEGEINIINPNDF